MAAQEAQVPLSLAENFIIDEPPPSQASQTRRSASISRSSFKSKGFRAGVGLEFVARRTLGIVLLLITVILWTGSNFLASVSTIQHRKIIR